MVDHSPFKADAGVRFSYRVPDKPAMNRMWVKPDGCKPQDTKSWFCLWGQNESPAMFPSNTWIKHCSAGLTP